MAAVATVAHTLTDTPPLVMGVVNATPDSFVSEVRTPDAAASIERGRQLLGEGAHIVDIGGESTRPGAEPVSTSEEIDRVVPVIEGLVSELPEGARLSVDTRHESVARAAVHAGATIVNDMSATLGAVAGELGASYVSAHMRGTPGTMQEDPVYVDLFGEIMQVVIDGARAAASAGSPQVWIDPGIGFGKTVDHNLDLIANIDHFTTTEFGVLIGVSRKSVIGHLHSASDAGEPVGQATPTPTDDRLVGSLAIGVWSAALGVSIVRVHDVLGTVQALEVVAALNRV